MCDPMTIAGIALSTVGGLASAQTEQNFIDAMNQQNLLAFETSQKAREAERTRQNDYEAEANTNFADTLGAMGRDEFDASKDTAAANFVETLDARPSALNEAARLAGQDDASSVVKDRIALDVNTASTASRERIQRLATLLGYGTAGQDRAETFANSGDQMATLGGIRRGSLGVAQQEQTIPAADVRKGSNMLGDILSGIGGIMSGGGLNFGGAGATAGSSLAPMTSIRPKPRPAFI